MGFHYRYDEKQQQFAHASAIMILTPTGVISRYLYGIHYPSRDVRFALAEAAEGKLTMTVEKLLLFCYHYDPQANRYVLFAMNVMRTGGVLTVLLISFTLWRLFRADRVRTRTLAAGLATRPEPPGRNCINGVASCPHVAPAGLRSSLKRSISFTWDFLVLCALLFIGIAGAAVYFSWRFRYKPGRVTPHITHNTPLELLWTVLPLLLCVVIFFIGLKGWMEYSVAPGDAMEIQVTAKKWLWQFEYPDGSRTINELHLPFNKPVKFTMTSEDVLHDFFVPVMRVKHDIVPGRYTRDLVSAECDGRFRFHLRRILRQRPFRYARQADGGKRRRLREVPGDRRNGMGRISRQKPVAGMGQDPVGAQRLQ